MARSDFLNIELTAAALKIAGPKGAVRVTRRHIDYVFVPGAPTRVLTSEWNRVLSAQKCGGESLLQVAAIVKKQESTVDAPISVDDGSEKPRGGK